MQFQFRKQNLQILFAQFLLNVFIVEREAEENISDLIISLKEFITTLICLHLHSYFIMLRDCGRNETIYIYKKKCCECLLHRLLMFLLSFVFKLKIFLCGAEIFIFHEMLVVSVVLRECNKESSLLCNWIWSINGIYSYYTNQIIASNFDFLLWREWERQKINATRYFLFRGWEVYEQFHFGNNLYCLLWLNRTLC